MTTNYIYQNILFDDSYVSWMQRNRLVFVAIYEFRTILPIMFGLMQSLQ